MTRGSARGGNTESRTELDLQWWEHTQSGMQRPLQQISHSTQALFILWDYHADRRRQRLTQAGRHRHRQTEDTQTCTQHIRRPRERPRESSPGFVDISLGSPPTGPSCVWGVCVFVCVDLSRSTSLFFVLSLSSCVWLCVCMCVCVFVCWCVFAKLNTALRNVQAQPPIQTDGQKTNKDTCKMPLTRVPHIEQLPASPVARGCCRAAWRTRRASSRGRRNRTCPPQSPKHSRGPRTPASSRPASRILTTLARAK